MKFYKVSPNGLQISDGKDLETKILTWGKYNMKTKTSIFHHTFAFAYVLLVAVLFTGCADVTPIEACAIDSPYGFWGGLWHGIIAPFSFIGSLFSDDIAMYAVNNNGGWYDFGFALGAGILFGGGSSSSK